MKKFKMKSYEEFTHKIQFNEMNELADELFSAIKKGIKNNNKKVGVCDVEIEEEQEVVRLYSSHDDWPTALNSCMKAFIITEEYEKCTEIQNLLKEYESKKTVSKKSKSKSNE
jgi:hypothetical protein